MKVIAARRDARGRVVRRFAPGVGLMLAGLTAGVMVAAGFGAENGSLAALVAAAPLGLGIGGVLVARAVDRSARPGWRDDELVRLLAPALDERWLLVLRPELPGVGRGLAALLIGPPGVRVIVVRTWHGRYRLRGRRWEYDARGRHGWITCRTDPGHEAVQLRDAVARWATSQLEQQLPIEPLVAFPRRVSRIVLEEPEVEVITPDNAPWWAQRIGRVQRLDPTRVATLVRAFSA
jgi:hypothetical protein